MRGEFPFLVFIASGHINENAWSPTLMQTKPNKLCKILCSSSMATIHSCKGLGARHSKLCLRNNPHGRLFRIACSSEARLQPFHFSFPVRDIGEARDFYSGVLGCSEGRSAKTWVDFNLFGHQIVSHEVKGYDARSSMNDVDGDPVPVPHFGLALTVDQFHELAKRVEGSGVIFEITPHIRFEGQPGEQWTMFFRDPSGNALEFKAMSNPDNLFAKYSVDGYKSNFS